MHSPAFLVRPYKVYVVLAVALVSTMLIYAGIVILTRTPPVRHEYVIWRNAGLVSARFGGECNIIEVVPGTNYIMQIFEEGGQLSAWKKFWYVYSTRSRPHRSLFLLLGSEIAEGTRYDVHVANDTIEMSGIGGGSFEFLGGTSSGTLSVVLKRLRSSKARATVSGKLMFDQNDAGDVATGVLSLDVDKEFQIRSSADYEPEWRMGNLDGDNATRKWGAGRNDMGQGSTNGAE